MHRFKDLRLRTAAKLTNNNRSAQRRPRQAADYLQAGNTGFKGELSVFDNEPKSVYWTGSIDFVWPPFWNMSYSTSALMRDLHQREDFQVNSSSLKKRQRAINPCHKAAVSGGTALTEGNCVIMQDVFEVFKNKSLNKAVLTVTSLLLMDYIKQSYFLPVYTLFYSFYQESFCLPLGSFNRFKESRQIASCWGKNPEFSHISAENTCFVTFESI